MPLKVGFAIVFLLLLLGCDGSRKSDGNIVDSVDLSTSWSLPTSYVELSSGDPIIVSTITPAGTVVFTMSAGFTGLQFNEQLNITTIRSDTTGYLINSGEASVEYINHSSGRHFIASSGSFNIIDVQPVGGRITGSFTVNNNDRVGMSGSFFATRE